MTAINQDFTMWQGEDVVVTVPITNAAGTPVSLTGATAVVWKAFAITSASASSAAVSKSLGSGVALANSADTDDAVVITLADTDTEALATGRYYHECRVTDSAGREQVVFVGNLVLKQSKTNP